MSLANDVRQHCKETYIDPARKRGEKRSQSDQGTYIVI